MKCRDVGLRKETIALSAENMPKSDPDGAWKRVLRARFLWTVLEIEGEGRIDGIVPIEKRISSVNTRLDSKTETGITEFWFGDDE